MKKFLIGTLVTLVIIAGLGYGVYYFGTNVASDKLVDTMTKDLNDSGQMNDVRAMIESDPVLQEMMNEAKIADPNTLPFTTKGEATRVLINKIGITNLQNISQNTASKEEILSVLKQNLTEEEMLALQVLAYEEIYNK